ncbi:MAG: sodium:proton antiporter [Acidobacteria bacterium]|nr:sodium:proton antiporter [Acidobacteriota bacterium]
MDLFNIIAILITLAAVFSYINHRYIGLPVTIGVMLIALAMSLMLNLLGWFGLGVEQQAVIWLARIDFDKTLLHGMLSFLLFAGALHIDINDLAERKWTIGTLATVGTLLSSLLVGVLTWWVLGWVGIELSFIYCLLFGSLISPTDPIAVLGILKTAKAPKSLETKITGESLFNDGVGIVIFLVFLEVATGTHEVSASHIGMLFVQEAIGGLLFGLGLGYLTYRMLQSVDNYQVEVLLTLALVAGGYGLAGALHLSGPIAIVVAGLFIGNHGRLFGMSDTTRHHLDVFWELVDEVLNAVLFVLIGLEVLVLTFTLDYLLASLLMIPLVLFARFVAIGIPITLLRSFRPFSPGVVRIMTWGGLRGGISVALALSIPPGPERDVILPITYAVVIFSIVVQGLTLKKLVKRTMLRYAEADA